MSRSELRRLLPEASASLLDMLGSAEGAVEPPIRSEIFGPQRFVQHGRSLGETHRAGKAGRSAATFFPRLNNNIGTLRAAHRYIGTQAATGYDISPAAEWLLDNFHLIEAQLKEIHQGLPRSYFRSLPVLQDEPLAGLPRVYGVAWAFVAHTDGAFDDSLLTHFLTAYQETRDLNLSELWALPTTLRVVLIENLRRLAERVAGNKAAREAANLCCDRIESCTVTTLRELLALLNARGVGRMFLAQMTQRLRARNTTGETDQADSTQRVHDWLTEQLPDAALVQDELSINQAADNLSVSNAVTSLRAIGDADWPEIIGESGSVMRLLLSCTAFAAEDINTRDQTLHGIERLATRSGRTELQVAQALFELLQPGSGGDVAAHESLVPAYWLVGGGRPALLRALGTSGRAPLATRFVDGFRSYALPVYLLCLLAGTLGLVASVVRHYNIELTRVDSVGALAWLAVILMLFPASEAVVAVINRLISESARPKHLPRLALINGIPDQHRVMVVIPSMLTSFEAIAELTHRLLLHFLANPEDNAQYALLSDWIDADTAQIASDDVLLTAAREQIRELNRQHSRPPGCAPRFILLHRGRQFSPGEQRWIGWERKRGKLEQLVAALAADSHFAFMPLGDESRIKADTRYIVTLDSDTQLPPGRLRELVGVAAHPFNQPRLDPLSRSITRGYAILQPRVVTPLPSAKTLTRFHWLFAGQCGIDPYSAASSEVYQDLFAEGTFTGKGLLNVRALQAVLSERLPEGQILSHDLLEGALARCAAVTDITLIEDAPSHADVAASRVHRWTRGDWQLLPILIAALLGDTRYPLRGINRWKMFDNLRRSLVAPMSLALLVLALATTVVSPWAALALVLAAFSAGPLMGAAAGFAPSRDDVALRYFYWQGGTDLARALMGGVWHLAGLLQQSLLAVDAIVRTLYRMLISHRYLLQWTTAAAAQASAKTDLRALLRQHWSLPVVALLLCVALLTAGTAHPLLTLALCLLWAGTPLWIWWVSRPRPSAETAALPVPDQEYLYGIARDTWRLFERCVVAEENHLPPDNLQRLPHDMVAHRTSPTNIGLYLLSVACARRFGWIGSVELVQRMQATLNTLSGLQRHRGHFLNWYDTQSCAPLLPMYVSTVDSGNLSGHLLAVAGACRELAHEPLASDAARRAIDQSMLRLAAMLPMWQSLLPTLSGDSALARLVALKDSLGECRNNAEDSDRMLADAGDELAAIVATSDDAESLSPPGASERDALLWLLADHVKTVRSLWRDCQAVADNAAAQTTTQLRELADQFEQLAWQADFSFLYHRKRHLFHIGLRVAEQQLDSGFYDLLASESRLTSLLAVAKGDAPTQHWVSLGRLFYAVGTIAGLRSWSGSMFEYLMPTLVLDEPEGSVCWYACQAALREQIAYARALAVPWGISESAYAGRDETLAYQYAPQGVPRLALRRTPVDELVIAPYATALAAQIAPRSACANFVALEKLGARGRYGFIEALDFTASRQTGNEPFTVVATFMAHHQGMTIVALANVLLEAPARRWGMACAHIEAVASLLHERAPREVPRLYAPPSSPPAQFFQQRTPGLLRELQPGTMAAEPTHVLGNGRYSVTLRANGAGYSRLGATSVTRYRDDALRDSYGNFFFLRRRDDSAPGSDSVQAASQPRLPSITLHPAGDVNARYSAVYHADRVCFDATWDDVQAHIAVWVSPEDDIEFRQVELRNMTGRSLDIELVSAFEVTLTDPRADEAHPAFTSLFVSAEWLANHQALLFERKPRLESETGLHAAHFLAESDAQVTAVRIQTDRLHWLGRNRAPGHPLAAFNDPPDPAPDSARATLNTGLDPVSALCVHLRIAANARAQLTFATAASDNSGTLRAVIDKYRQPSHIRRASLMSATLTGIRLRMLRISAENHAAIQSLTTALTLSITRQKFVASTADAALPTAADWCDRRLLWRLGISGDRPIILVSAGVAVGLGMLRTLTKALRLWSHGGIACDLVVVNDEPVSYQLELQRELVTLRDHHRADGGAQSSGGNPSITGFYVLRTDEISHDELRTLQLLARVRFDADGRPLAHHVQQWSERHQRALAKRRDAPTSSVASNATASTLVKVATGTFSDDAREFRFDVGSELRPTRPWANVLSNPEFGCQITEAGGGYTWAVNSRLNQLTAWSNDPVADAPSEWFLIQDLKTRNTWSVSPSAWGADVNYRISHGQGYSTIQHRRGECEVTASWCVDAKSSLKQVRLRLVNRGHQTLQLRLIGIMEWMMGGNRADRSTVRTAMLRPMPNEQKIVTLLCTQLERADGFGDGTAFLSLTAAADDLQQEADWTCDRRECFDPYGNLTLPDRFGQKSGVGLDPCAALSTRIVLAAGDAVERVFLIGYGDSVAAAQALAISAAGAPTGADNSAGKSAALDRIEAVRRQWDQLLDATTVTTPDPLFDAMVNRWLLYQTVSCRMWAKAGFYQAGGATGFRDQLQDSMALAWAAPDMLRRQILLCASRQFAEGDVQHWWHAPGGAGVRTHFSDDLLWLAYACVHYLQATADATLLAEEIPFIEGSNIADGAEDAYYAPTVSATSASVYEHAARAIDRSLRVGIHGLPLIGSGDWNDGMNRVGHQGRGESVWLGWFLCKLVADFAPLARERNDIARAQRWENAAIGWKAALLGQAWDGQWFKRAFFDDGQALGSQANVEARIDLIAQAWAVLSDVAPPEMQRDAMASVETLLIDEHGGLIKLLDPPLANASPSAGYIQAYPPGVRENGGQYSHGAVWALMAQAKFAREQHGSVEAIDRVYRDFTYLSAAHRAAHPEFGPRYGIEPYVMAGDVYTQNPYAGRGGWSWYTGAAAWMHRAAIESIFGLHLGAQTLSFTPCLPSHWPKAELTLRRDGRSMRFILIRATEADALAATATCNATLLPQGEPLHWPQLDSDCCFVIALPTS